MDDTVTKIIAFENGDLDEAATVQFFQELIDSGLAWQLQGSYGRMAAALIDEGWCHRPGEAPGSTCTECDEPGCPGIVECPRCGETEHGLAAQTHIADHGYCRECLAEWQEALTESMCNEETEA